ncbi:helix-turn-helix transcriptional regulator [Marilutibacter maris]|nr:AlpA family phage regulatory protein [Lysobacter maris]
MDSNAAPRKGDSVLRIQEVERRTGLRRASIYRRAAMGTFPKQIRLGPNTTGWLESEIDGFLAEAVAKRDAQVGTK